MDTRNEAQQLSVVDNITINAPASRVWKVLTLPNFIAQWDNIPDDLGDQPLRKGSVIEWQGFSRLTVTGFDPERFLKLKLHSPKWEFRPEDHDIAYSYSLAETDGHTKLSVIIGDFSVLPDGETYQDAALEFAEEAMPKIKELAEKMNEQLWDDTPRPDPLDV